MKTLLLFQRALLVTAFSSITAVVGFAGCSSEPASSGATCTADIASIRQNIILASCTLAGCHAADQPAAGLDLTREDLEAALVGVPAGLCNGALVVAGDPAASVLYQKITAPSCGMRMPMAGPLSADQIACIEKWIADMPSNGAGGGGGGGAGTGGGGGAGGTGGAGSGGSMPCETCGGAACIDLQTDANHCGTCNNVCGQNMVCNMGTCAGGCGALTQCGASCVDTQTDVSHCGICNMACPAGTPCTNGKCECPAGKSPCNGACVDTTSDPNNCGACGQECALGQTCSDGKCSCGLSSVSFSGAVQPILTAKCASAGCHAGVVPQAGLNLTNGKSYAAIVNVAASQCNDGRKRVKPSDPGASYVIDKMTNVDICFGTQMPKLGQIQSTEIQTVVDWICQGAPNN